MRKSLTIFDFGLNILMGIALVRAYSFFDNEIDRTEPGICRVHMAGSAIDTDTNAKRKALFPVPILTAPAGGALLPVTMHARPEVS
ncbi:hypothetical protein Cob_v005178 [Colletotrichum orbiculare MAFF 240422]|uniref:Uncharacterized protein n=1 Tax=Colletotrichum orbiculare (strain 104-T / ATCC 96160 / CBS 514.97 / LARS 414 / MAFF 240422) TaxID=1213857 RepID=A0A484FX12_COLOR|nr:hypothetical protein Cob_v005178 [Colletotrichum orbiculare MAFF 240422]